MKRTYAMAPFETFAEHAARERSETPYNYDFICRCREKALEYDREDSFLRGPMLRALKLAVPLHYRGKVFDCIRSFE